MRHRDIEFNVTRAGKFIGLNFSSYDKALLAAAERSAITERVHKIVVTAYSAKGAKWYADNFGKDNAVARFERSRSKDSGVTIDTYTVSVK